MINDQDHDILLKIVVKGQIYTGKSAIINSYVYNYFMERETCDLCVDYMFKYLEKDIFIKIFSYSNINNQDNKKVKLQIWDTFEVQRFSMKQKTELNYTQGLVLVYSITDRHSFEKVQEYIGVCNYFREQKDLIIILVGNKCDLEMKRDVSKYEGQQLADSIGIKFYEISAKTFKNINTCFEELTHSMLQTL